MGEPDPASSGGRPPEGGVPGLRFELKEDVDRLIELVKARKGVSLEDMALELNWSPRYLDKIAKVSIMVSRHAGTPMILTDGRLELAQA